jgi:hypothetical protein
MRNGLLNGAAAGVFREEETIKMLKGTQKRVKTRSPSEAVLSEAVGTTQPVEKPLRAVF